MLKNNLFLIFFSIFSVIACADNNLNNISSLDKDKSKLISLIHNITDSPVKTQLEAETRLNVKFLDEVSKPYLPNGIKKLSENSFFKYAKYDDKTQFLSLYLKPEICLLREDAIAVFGLDFSFYIPISHNYSTEKESKPFQGVLEYISYKISKVELTLVFPVNKKTGLQEDKSCLTKISIGLNRGN